MIEQSQQPDSFDKITSQSTEMFRLIVENVKDYAIFMTDPEGIVVSWNPGVEKLLGYTESAIVGQPISIIFTAEDQAAGDHLKEMKMAAAKGHSEDKRWHERRDGSRFWANGLVMPLKNQDGILCGFAKVMRDDTPQKLAEAKLEAAIGYTENILASIGDAFYTFDRDLRYVIVNKATTEMFNLPESAFLGKTLWELFPEVEGSVFHREIKQALAEGTTRVFENYYPPLDRWFENRVYPSPEGLSIFTTEITARKRIEESLAQLTQKSEQQRRLYETILSNTPDLVYVFGLDHRFVYANKALLTMWGKTWDEALGKNCLELGYEPWHAKRHDREIEQVKATKQPIRGVVPFNGTQGRRIYDYIFTPVIGANGEVEAVAGTTRDVTESKEFEEKLLENEQRYRALVEATATTVWRADIHGELTFVGDSWTQMSGQSVEDVLKWGWLEAIHPEDRQSTASIWHNALRNKTLYSTEFRVLTVTGEYRWYVASAVPIFDVAGEVREWVGSNIDITARKRAEQERVETLMQLEAERARLAYIFEQAPAFVTVLRGAEHAYELTNPAYLQLIGHRRVVGKTVREALPELAGQGYFELLDRVYQSGEAFIGNEMPVEFQYTPDSPLEKRFVNFVFQPIFDASGGSSGIFVHGIDITEQVEARRQAEEANRLKDEFLATLSHELRTPLNAILGWSQMLQNGSLDQAGAQKALATIERSARSQNQLIEDILDVSRIITGKLRLDVRAVDLPGVIIAATDAARPGAAAKNIRLQNLIDPSAGPISGDPDRLQQVVWNLLSNAVKFTPKGGRVQIRLERVNSHVEITVSDTGKGIEAEFLPHVFDRFRQSDGSMTRRHGGLGLGLAIVRQIVELHGGTVSVDSAGEGQGATFVVNLPLLPVRRELESNVPRVHPKVSTDAPADCPAELDDLKILLVDDEADSRELLDVILSSCGAVVKTASSAGEALALIKSEKFEVLISDIGMPDEDGFSLIGKIRDLPIESGSRIPAIALTAYARSEDRIQALRAGFQMHIAKPVEPVELITVVANLAERVDKNK